ncbi:prepilin-type N-terminal cleavage/methylation domain-containing protein [Colwellia sp. E2M01]|uniref:type II secretion system protein n=1 Tax=Colwellia sp. E2M01 TaxID=2841561 RepID=UPI001C08C975|nr:prepilin-type N-terminal cleavage/methylation domain-containing protein [Colwellia sp. E2M01]MBU2869355.1 prepilin-type N-terminal cleavage/methylation domain-containing protein [Colwellia sp. E2M01]
MAHNLKAYQKNIGFTLIELLVVMVILGITSSLVAPDMFAIVKRSQAKTELEKIKAIAALSIERSFFSSSKIAIKFSENKVTFSQNDNAVVPSNKTLKTIESSFFTFADTDIVIINGQWQGNEAVKITKSPENKLQEFVLIDMSRSLLGKVNASEVGNIETNNSNTENVDSLIESNEVDL